jgi:hypothetical protein
MKSITICVAAAVLTGVAFAKLPAPSDEAKAKAAEAAAKTAHAGKVEAFLLCKAQDKVVARTNNASKPVGKDAKAAASASACADPGPFVYTPAAPAAATSPAASAAVAAAPVADKPKK